MRAVFLDRDGTINKKAPEGEYVSTPEDVELLPGVTAAIKRLNHAGVLVVVVTNQRGIAIGRYSEEDVAKTHTHLSRLLSTAGAHVDQYFFCPHDAGTCDCRKPLPGLIWQAMQSFPDIDLSRSLLIGDSATDIQAAASAGVSAAILSDGWSYHHPNELTELVDAFLLEEVN